MSRRRKEPLPIQGAQEVVDEVANREGLPTPKETHHALDEQVDVPTADAPTEQLESHMPGTRGAERAELKTTGNAMARLYRLFREGLRPSNLKSSYGRKPLVLLMVISMFSIFGNAITSVALPEIQRDLEINIRFIITLGSWAGLLGVLLSVPIGYMGDRKRRVTMYGVGGAVASLSHLLTGTASGKAGLASGTLVNEIGARGPDSVGFSLIADYVPPEYRGQSFAFRHAATSIALVFAPLLGGYMAKTIGWRVPFMIVGVVGALFSLWFISMPEPIRGYHERKAFGANEEIARRQQEAPSFGEAFRAAWGVRTLRRYAYSTPFLQLSSLGFGLFYGFYLARTHGLDAFQRGIFASIGAFVGLLGLVIGGPLVDRIIGRNPGRVVMFSGIAGIATAIGYAGIALAPSPIFVLLLSLPINFGNAVIRPASAAVNSLVIPPRLRNLGLSVLEYWTIPVFFAFPVIGGIAGANGFRAALLVFVPISIIGSAIVITAGPYVEFDIRSATSAAMASEEWRRAREEGRAKMLVLRDVDVHYESVQVLFGVDLDVQEGEMIALLGTNGAGKSTLLRAISGTQEASGGAIVFDGYDITHVPPYEISSHGIAQTPGGRGVFPGLTVRENMQLAGWLYGEDPKHAEEVEQVYDYFPVLRERLDQQAGSLSGGEQQMLTLAQAFLARPKLLMIDELSLGLAPAVVEQLLGIVRAIHARGTTIIIVEQSVNVALTLAERAVFMEKGEIRFDGPTEELLGRPDIMRAVFLKGSSSLSIDVGAGPPSRLDDSERANILEVVGLTKSYGGVMAVDDVSFALRENEVLGFIGPNGAGKTTVLELVSGFNEPDAGQVIYQGRDITLLPPDQRAHLGLIRRFQDAKLFPSLTLHETIAIAFERQVEVKSMVLQGLGLPQARQAEQRIRRKVDRLIELLGLEAYRDKFISEVSTGTRRIVDIACVLAAEPRVLLLDEPSSGLAQREAENLAPLLNQVRRETGCSMIIIEHDMPLISAVSDELVAMELGKIVVRGQPDDVLNDERVVRSYLGTSEETIRRSGQVKGK
jgi:branched-chain amino acid transport system ATP-binding protein